MRRIIDETNAPRFIAGLKEKDTFVILLTGCFEILHAGHLAYFAAAKKHKFHGKRTHVIVGVESDSTLLINRIDKLRPLFKQSERCETVASADCVDTVIRFDPNLALDYADVTAFTLRLRKLKPDAMGVSYNDSLSFFRDIMHMQTQECAAAGVLILPVIHHVRTHATDAVDVLNRKNFTMPAEPGVLWQSKTARRTA